MKKNAKRWLAMLLCLTMALTLLPAMALPSFAQETGQEENIPDNTGSQDEQGAGQGDEQAEEAGAGNNDLGVGELEDGESDPAGDSNDIAGQAYEDLPDGALVDNWAQDAQTVRGTGSVCEVTSKDGHLLLKVGSGNSNNGDQWTGEKTGTGPAVFVSDEMGTDLEADEQGNYKVTFKMKPLLDGICFGVYVNYKNPNGGMLMGYNTPGAWFWQKYGGGGAWSTDTLPGPELVKDTIYDVELT